MSKRTVIKIHGKSYYAERNKKGQFTDITGINKSIKSDMKKSNAKTVKPGHGHQGDLKRK
ncbi:MAG: hypothetical protein AAB624_03070 [Patescibacteria group bacterium]